MLRLLPRLDSSRIDGRRPPDGVEPYAAALRVIAARHGLDAGQPRRFSRGWQPTFALGGGQVVKLCAPPLPRKPDAEAQVLAHVADRLSVATPPVLGVGQIEDWSYLVMGRVAGVELPEVWPRLGPSERVELCRSLGGVVAQLHALPTEPIQGSSPVWEAMLEAQVARCPEHQARVGTSPAWVAQIPEFLATVGLDMSEDDRLVLLHTELMREHVLVGRDAESCIVRGLVDFGEAIVGHREYEFAAVGLFLTEGEPAPLRAFLRAYGYADPELRPELQERVMAYALLHRHSNLKWFLERHPPHPGRATLRDLARQWWAFD